MPAASTSSVLDVKGGRRGRWRRGGTPSFSLVEVALALGVISFCIVPLLALLSVGLQAGKSSQQDTALALAVRYVVADLRRQPYASLAGQTYVFDYQGVPTSPNAISTLPGYYTSTVSIIANPLSSVSGAGALAGVRITFTWPGQSSGGANAQVFQTSLSAY